MHQIFSHFVCSGMAFGAHRWLGVLQRQCERVASLMARNISDLGGITKIPSDFCFPYVCVFILYILLAKS